MKRFLVAVIVGMVIVMTLAACGGGSTDGGWLGHATGRVYFLQISNGTGEVDYAVNYNGRVERFHGGVVVHDDGTIEVDGMVDGPLKDCSVCPYQLTNGNLVINYQYQPYGGGGPVSGTMTFSSSDISAYQQDIQGLNSQGG